MATEAPADAKTILYRIDRLLYEVHHACHRLESNESTTDTVADLREIAVNGRAALHVLLTLRTKHRLAFNRWYEPYKQEIAADELMIYFDRLRSTFLKEGWPSDVWANIHVAIVNDEPDMSVKIAAPEPPRLPTEHRGEPITTNDLAVLCRLYVTNLGRIYTAAQEFVAGLEPGSDPTQSS